MQLEIKHVFQTTNEKEKAEKVIRLAEKIIKQHLKEGKHI